MLWTRRRAEETSLGLDGTLMSRRIVPRPVRHMVYIPISVRPPKRLGDGFRLSCVRRKPVLTFTMDGIDGMPLGVQMCIRRCNCTVPVHTVQSFEW